MFIPTLRWLFAAVVVVVTTQLAATTCYDLDEAETLFEKFIQDFDKKYENELERLHRLAIFKDNLRKINKMNSEQQTAVFAINMFADLLQAEFIEKYTGIKSNKRNVTDGPVCEHSSGDILGLETADSWDWREHNAVTPIKNQGNCGSCWSFATTGTMEGNYAVTHGTLLSFSEQQLVDCGKYTKGCLGGWLTDAIRYSKEAGVALEKDYPYVAAQGSCKNVPITAHVAACKDFTSISEDKLKGALIKYGPIAVAIDADGIAFYSGGIVPASKCPNGSPDHGVLLVGYGTENGTPFWILKNSWGLKYGEQGYFRISRGDNACGLVEYEVIAAEMA